MQTDASDSDAFFLTRNDWFSSALTLLLLVGGLAFGTLLRQQDQAQVWMLESREAGIEALYPAGWITDSGDNYVVRITDPRSRPFKTHYVITVRPFGAQSSVRNLLDDLTIQRADDLAAYRVLSIGEVSIAGVLLTRMDFTYVDADPNPFVQRVPVVVQGRDIVILDGNRAIIATFLSEQERFEGNLPAFETFLLSLRY